MAENSECPEYISDEEIVEGPTQEILQYAIYNDKPHSHEKINSKLRYQWLKS